MASMYDAHMQLPKPEIKVDGDGFGPTLDSLLGMSIENGNNMGFTLQKIVYTANFPSGKTDALVTYRPNMVHVAQLSSRSGGTRANAYLNTDSAQNTEMKLVPGDKILGAHLTILDSRGDNTRSGTATAGVVPVSNKLPDSGSNTVHGVFTTSEGSTVTALSLDGGSSIGAGGISFIAAHTTGLDVHNPVPYVVQDVSSVLNDLATPALTVVYNGVANTGDLMGKLTVYALVGKRPVGGVSRPGGSLPIDYLAQYTCQHTTTVGHGH